MSRNNENIGDDISASINLIDDLMFTKVWEFVGLNWAELNNEVDVMEWINVDDPSDYSSEGNYDFDRFNLIRAAVMFHWRTNYR